MKRLILIILVVFLSGCYTGKSAQWHRENGYYDVDVCKEYGWCYKPSAVKWFVHPKQHPEGADNQREVAPEPPAPEPEPPAREPPGPPQCN